MSSTTQLLHHTTEPSPKSEEESTVPYNTNSLAQPLLPLLETDQENNSSSNSSSESAKDFSSSQNKKNPNNSNTICTSNNNNNNTIMSSSSQQNSFNPHEEKTNFKHLIYKILTLLTSGTILGIILPKNKDLPTPTSQYLSSIIGYTYFLCWSVSFYPQIILNYKRKNTTGLSPDFSILNVVGFTCYSIYVCFLFWNSSVRNQYQQRFGGSGSGSGDNDDNSSVPVQSNDVAFAIRAFVLSSVQVGQIIFYYYQAGGRRDVRISTSIHSLISMLHSTTKYFLLGCVVLCIIYAILVSNQIHGLIFLDYLYMLSSIKLVITIIKYIPQVILNHQRKSTIGWNIWNVLLDFSGGLLSLTQLIMDSFALNDFSAITGNWVKFGLGFVSLFFDVSCFFLVLLFYYLFPIIIVVES